MNINYLLLPIIEGVKDPLQPYPGAPELYSQLRADLIANTARQYRHTRKLWENYNSTSGEGRGTAPFTV